MQVVLDDNWKRSYTRAKAAFPLPSLRRNKMWPTVSRLDDVHGDRNLVCSCEPIEVTPLRAAATSVYRVLATAGAVSLVWVAPTTPTLAI